VIQVIVLTSDRQLEDTVKATGLPVTVLPASDMGAASSLVTKGASAIVFDLRRQFAIPPVISAIRRQAPQIGVVLVVSALDPNFLVDAMRAGVNEVVADPVTTDELKQAIERVAGELTHEAGKIYGFVGAKGGVGTTTIAVNVATALGAISKPARCLIIDCHRTGGDASLFLGAEPRFSIVDALQNTHRLDHVFFKNLVTQVAPSTDLLASPEHASAGSFDDGIQRVLSSASFIYKHTVLDLTRSDDAVLHSLDLLTTIYIVANQELATVKSANRLASTLRERYGRGKVGLVLSRSDGQADIGQADVEKAAGCAVVCAFPSDYRMALQALNKGRPLALENHNELSAALKRFAYQLAGERPARDGARPSGLFGRLKHSRS